jgi:hypothetical protein
MSLRFRRSVRLFPGVRLNFSRSGVSTTVGVRGASMTLGGQGAHVNVGLPGSGLSYRTRVTPPPAGRPQPWAIQPTPAPQSPPLPNPADDASTPAAARQIRSAEVSALTTAGLGELKRLINEAEVRRGELVRAVSSQTGTLAKAQARLRLSQAFIVRLFTAKAVPRLAEAVQAAEDQLGQSRAELEGCHIEVDFGLDDATLGSYAALTRSFEALSACDRIWDITSTMEVNRVAERTAATMRVDRTPVRFEFAGAEIVKSKYQVMQLGNVGGRDLQIFPGFVMMRDATYDFGLVEFGEFEMKLSRTRFIEEGYIPADTQEVGQTWKKANKDGSPDRRFKENFEIPIVEYGELTLSSTTGLLEAYEFSSYSKTQAFAQAFDNHKRALAALASTGGPATTQDPVGEDQPEEHSLEPSPAAVSVKPAKGLWLDWAALALIVVSLGAGVLWVRGHAAELNPPVAAAVTDRGAVATSGAVAQPPSPRPHHRRRHHRTIAASADGT